MNTVVKKNKKNINTVFVFSATNLRDICTSHQFLIDSQKQQQQKRV